MTSDRTAGGGVTARALVRRNGAPWLTLVVVGATVAVNLWTFASPAVGDALRRDPDGLGLHNLWRIATPLLTQTDGWVQAGFNWVTALVFGVAVEWILGRRRWVGLYLLGGLVGQALGYRWEAPGGGTSVAVAGLVGGLAVALLLGWALEWAVVCDAVELVAPLAIGVAGYGLILAGGAIGGWVGPVVVIVLFAVGVNVGTRLVVPRTAARIGGVSLLVAAVVLLALADHHGASLLTGGIVAVVWPVGPSDPSEAALPER